MSFMTCLNHSTIMSAPLETAVSAAEKAGFDGFDLWKQHLESYLAESGPDKLKKLFDSVRITPVCLTGIGGFMQATEEEFGEIEKNTRPLFAALQELGVDTVVVNQSEKKRGYEESLELAVERTRQLADIAEGYQIKLALEQLGFSDFINSTERALAVFRAVDRKNVGLLIDTYHMYKAGDTVEALEKIPTGSIFFVHLANILDIPREKITDSERELPSEGKMDLLPALEKMAEKGYSGCLSVELFRKDYWGRSPFEVARMAKESSDALIGRMKGNRDG